MSTAMTATVGPMPQTPEWTALRYFDPDRERPVIFGASEAAAACGMSPYTTPLELFLLKRRELDPEEENDAMRLGKKLEPIVLDEYQLRTGRVLAVDLPMFLHADHAFMAATPDAMAESDTVAVDAKTSSFRRYNRSADVADEKFGEEGTDQMPSDYVLQAQQQIAVLGVDSVDFPVLFDGRTLRIYTVQRNDELINIVTSAERELAERIASDDPPEPTWEHEKTKALLRELHGFDEASVVELSDEATVLWNRHLVARQQIKELEKFDRECLNKILHEQGDAEFGRLQSDLAGRELRRVRVSPTYWSQHDIDRIELGECKRSGYEYLKERKVKA